jgi:hypothetical protein
MPPSAGSRVDPDVADTSVDVPVVDPRAGSYDDGTPWTHDPVFACAGEMAARMRSHPWEDHVLGAPARWPAVLRTAVSMVLRSRHPMMLTWGERFVMLYNDAYVPVLGDKHPAALGSPLAEQFSEVWEVVGPVQEALLRGAEATWDRTSRWSSSGATGRRSASSPSPPPRCPTGTGPAASSPSSP